MNLTKTIIMALPAVAARMTVIVIALSIAVAAERIPCSARLLEGNVQLDSQDAKIEEIKPQTPQLDTTKVLNGSATEKPPAWINGKVFSNDSMFMYSFWTVPPFKKEFRWQIPEKHSTVIRMRAGVVKYWKGWKPDGACPVVVEPLGDGRFKFHHERPDGPHGYLERVGTNDNGFPKYRFWFDDLAE